MKNERRIGVILSYLSIILHMSVGFLYVPLLLKYMGQSEYGLYQLMGSLVAYFSVMDFGLSSTVTKFYSRYLAVNDTRNMENILGTSRIIYYLIAIISSLIGIVLYLNIESIFDSSFSIYEIVQSKKIFTVLLVNILITLLTNIYTSVITANEKFIFLRLLSIFQTILQPFAVIAIVSVSPKAFTMTLVLTSFNFISGIIKIIYFKKVLKTSIKLHFINKELLKSMLTFSLNIFIVSVVDQLFWRSNQLVLGVLLGTTAVAVYSIAAQIYMNYMPLSTVIQGVFLPQITKLVSNNISDIELSGIFIKIGRIQFILLGTVLSGFILLGKEFISLWVGNEYISAYWLTIIILIPFTIDLIQNIGLIIMQAKDKYSFRAKMLVFMAFLNITLVIFMSKIFGLMGAASATGFTLFLGNGVIMNIYYSKVLNIEIGKFWNNIFRMALPFGVSYFIGVIIKSLVPISNFYLFIFVGTLFLIIHSSIVWALVMNTYEKNIFIIPYNKIIKKLK